jgi:hypothetical protein
MPLLSGRVCPQVFWGVRWIFPALHVLLTETIVWLVVKTAKIDSGTLKLKSSLLFKRKGMGIFINQWPDIPKVNKKYFDLQEISNITLAMPNLVS